jgi:hypothetical protein
MGIAQDVMSSAGVAERQLPPAASAPENAGEERVAMLDHAALFSALGVVSEII